jgi:hypothetical protein
MAMNRSRRTSNINNVVLYDASGNVTIPQIDNANTDTDEFIVSDNGTIKYRTGSEVLSDIGAQGAITLTTTGTTGAATLVGNTLNIPQYVTGAGFVPVGRELTINGVTYDLSADRSWSITAGVSSVTGTAPINAADASGAITISIDQADTTTDGYLTSADWNTFNGKQPAGNYITALTGEVTAAGPGSVAATVSNAAVIGKVLTGLSITGAAITSGDSILGAMGKLQNQINGLTGSLIYKGSWNAATNTPTINSGVGVAGNFYIVTVPGSTTIDGVSSWAVGDWIIFSGAVWQKVPNTNTVVSVNSYTGAVVLTTDDIAEDASPTNLWFTNARAQAAITGGASSIVTTDLTASRALISNASGKVAVSAVTSTELGYLTGVSSAIQTQIDGKEPTIAAAATDPTLKYWRGDKSWQTLPVYTFNSLSPMTTLGDIIYGAASGAGTRLAGNTTVNRRFLRQTGTGTASAAPAWDGLVSGDIPNNSAEAGSVANSLTFKADGTGAAATVTYNGSTARTISYNTVGAQPAALNLDSLAGLTYAASAIVRMTAANTFTLDTGNYLALTSQTAAKFLASPTAAAGVPSFRILAAGDIPALDYLSNSTTSTQDGYFGNINLYDDSTPSHYLTITNSANLTAARTLSINVNDVNRTISLSGNLTVSAAATISGTNTGDQDLSGYVTGSAGSTRLAYFDGVSSITGSTTLTYSPTAALLVNNSVTAASAIARGVNITSTLTAAANSDVLVGLNIAPTFTNGAFTGVSNIALRVTGNATVTGTITGTLSGNASTATALATARTLTIGATGKTFDGSADRTWTLGEIGAMSNPMTTLGDIIYGAASGAPTRLAGSTSASKRFLSQTGDGTASAAPSWTALVSGDIPNNAANTSGNAGTATKLATARAINGVDFDGSAAITITANTGTSLTFNNGGAGATSGTTFNGSTARTISYNTIGAPATDGTNATGTWAIDIAGQVSKSVAAGSDANWLYGIIGTNDYFRVRAGGAANAGYLEIATADDGDEPIYVRQYTGLFATVARTATLLNASGNTIFPGTLTASNFSGSSSGTNTGDQTNITGNAGTATSLQTARTITVGATGRSFNGTADISWTLAEIGAQAAGSYVTTNTYQSITGYKEFASYGSGNKTGFLCNNATTGFMFMQNVSTGKTWDWEILSTGNMSLNESGVSSRLMLYAGGGARIYGDLTADRFFEASDIRYKDVIHTNPAIDLSGVDVIKYKMIDDELGQVRYGYSAQDVQAVCADLVTEKNERLYLNYSDVHTLKIAALEKRVKELELKLGI